MWTRLVPTCTKAYIHGGNLTGGIYNNQTIFPEGFDPAANGMVDTSDDISSDDSVETLPDGNQTREFFIEVSKGIDFISLPLQPESVVRARDLLTKLNATLILQYNRDEKYFQGFTENFPGSGFEIEGGRGYIVNRRESQIVSLFRHSLV